MEGFKLKCIDCGLDYDKLDTAISLCEKLKNILPNSNVVHLSNKLKEEFIEEQQVIEQVYEERLAQLKSTLGKYWEVSFNKANSDYTYHKVLIFPHKIIQTNSTYWFVKGYIDDEYHSGMSDENIDYLTMWIRNDIIFKEITKEEFLERVNAHTNEVLNIRLQKMETYKEPMFE